MALHDPIIDFIGDFGLWQFAIYMVITISEIPGAMQLFIMTFFAPPVDFWCSRTLPYHNLSVDQWLNLSNPDSIKPEDNINQCRIYQAYTDGFSPNGTEDPDKILSCDKWEYDLGIYHRTMREEFDLVCDKDILISVSNSVNMACFMASMLVNGYLSDRFGRRIMILIDTVALFVISIIMVFSSSFMMFMILKGIQMFFKVGIATTGFVLFTEVTSEKYRATLGNLFFWGFAVGITAFAGIVYLLLDWVYIQWAISAPFGLFIILFWFLPESPRWLLTKGKINETVKVIEQAAKYNKIKLPSKHELEQQLKKICEQDMKTDSSNVHQYSILDLFRSKSIRIKTFLLFLCWAVNAFVYYGLSFNTNDLGGNPFINFAISSAVEIPAYIFSAIVVRYVGRRIPLVIMLVIAGLACATPIVIPESMETLKIVFPMIGKLCISSSFAMIYVYTAELYPTVIRSIGLSSCSMVGRVGSIVAPYVKELGKLSPYAPPAVYGILSVSIGLLMLYLPETKGAVIPDTIEEAEALSSKKKAGEEIEMKNVYA